MLASGHRPYDAAAPQAEAVSFKRNIGLFLATMIGIGAMMGPGIFALPAELAHMVGPIGTLTYLVMGAITVFTALNYSELGAAIPLAGGGYSFVSRTLPRPVAFFTGWFFWIGNTLACAMYAVIFALTLRSYFWPEASVALIVLLTTVAFGAVNLRGMSEAIKLIGKGIASLVGIRVPDKARVIGKAIKEIDIPRECVVAAVIRGKDFVVPRGDTVVQEGDEVVFVGPIAAITEAQEHFQLKG